MTFHLSGDINGEHIIHRDKCVSLKHIVICPALTLTIIQVCFEIETISKGHKDKMNFLTVSRMNWFIVSHGIFLGSGFRTIQQYYRSRYVFDRPHSRLHRTCQREGIDPIFLHMKKGNGVLEYVSHVHALNNALASRSKFDFMQRQIPSATHTRAQSQSLPVIPFEFSCTNQLISYS